MPEQTPETAVLIALPELADYTDRWRSASASGRPGVSLSRQIPPHATVLLPWAPLDDAEAFADAAARLAEAVDGSGPLELTFPTAEVFPDGGTVWLRPEPFDKVVDLVRTVLAAFPEYPPYGGLHPDPQPHVTVSFDGGTALLEEVRAAMRDSPPPTARVEELTIWHDDLATGIWHPAASVSL